MHTRPRLGLSYHGDHVMLVKNSPEMHARCRKKCMQGVVNGDSHCHSYTWSFVLYCWLGQ